MQVPFVRRILSSLIGAGKLSRDDTILSVCADPRDDRLFSELHFTHVTLTNLTNLEKRIELSEGSAFEWATEDAQALSYGDDSFDVVFVSAGLHHCQWPHRALAEMYRVARKTVIVVESRESALMRLAVRLGLSRQYEINRTLATTLEFGGMNGGPIPNYVYRWTEREFVKAVQCMDPTGKHRFDFFYDYAFRRRIHPMVDPLVRIALGVLRRILPRQGNCFGMVAYPPRVPEDLWPWLRTEGDEVRLDEGYIRAMKSFTND